MLFLFVLEILAVQLPGRHSKVLMFVSRFIILKSFVFVDIILSLLSHSWHSHEHISM